MPDKLMSFSEHLEELRSRLKYCAYALVVAMFVAYYFAEILFVLLAQPLISAWAEAGLGTPRLNFASPVEPFFTYMKIALIAGAFAASPVIFYQLWAFVAPGLYKTEKRYVLPFVTVSAALFIGGATFGYFLVFPVAFRFLLGFAKTNLGAMEKLFGGAVKFSVQKPLDLTPVLMMGEYFSFVWKLLLAFGLVFELPVLISFFALVGIVDHKKLWRFNRYFVIIAFVVGAILTPGPDVISQILMSLPLIILYNLSIGLAYLISRRRLRRQAEAEAAAAADEGPPDGPR